MGVLGRLGAGETARFPTGASGVLGRALATACEEHDVQLFATTHSLEALDAMLKSEAVRRDGIVAFRLPQAGAEEKPARFSGEMLHRLRYERGLDVR